MTNNRKRFTSHSIYLVTFPFIAILGLLALIAPQAMRADGTILYVNKDAPGPVEDGTSWETAYTHLQAALDAADDGDEIWVAKGVYTPTATHSPVIGPTFPVLEDIALYGGFYGDETERSERDWETHLTILSGDLDGDDITGGTGIVTDTANIVGTNAETVVLVDSFLGSTTVLDGFIITAGKGTGHGGGLQNYGGPTLTNLIFSGNEADDGGGMYNAPDSMDVPLLTNVLFTYNRAWTGGGLVNTEGVSIQIREVTFHSNYADGTGGGMFHCGSTATVEDVVFENNRAGSNGGGMDVAGATYMTRTTFISNTASLGGGLHSDTRAIIALNDVTFVGNEAVDGGGLYQYRDRIPDLYNVSFIRNVATGNGGGMYLHTYADTLVAADTVTFTQNHAGNHGGGLYTDIDYALNRAVFNDNTAGKNGGALYMYQYAEQVTLTDAVFERNMAEHGGAIYQHYGDITIVDSTFTNNEAALEGGALYNYSWNTTTITDCTFSDNTAQEGGALWVYGYASIARSTFGDNRATNGVGGGAYLGYQATLDNVTFIDNISSSSGGGLVIAGHADLTSVVFDGNEANDGAGLITDGDGDITLKDVVFSDNVASSSGGGLWAHKGLVLENAGFYHNTAGTYGGGMYSEGASPAWPMALTNVTFRENVASEGGGIHSRGGLFVLNNAVFHGNTAMNGGGLYAEDALDANNAVFSGNTVSHHGGGLYLNVSPYISSTLTNLSVFDNSTQDEDGGGGVYIRSGSVNTYNSIFWHNQAASEYTQIHVYEGAVTIYDSLVQGGCPTGVTCANILTADPLVVRNPDSGDGDWSTFDDNDYGNLRLRPSSPAIDAGNNAVVTLATDLDGNLRIMGAAVDLGAYEVEVFTLDNPDPNTVYDFAPYSCGSVVFNDVGTLPASLSVMLTYAAPTSDGDGVPRRYDIIADGGSGYDATLVLCYEDGELVQAGILPEQEEDLHVYRWDQGAAEWIEYSEVDPVNNRITAIHVTAFGVWGIGTADARPTSARVQSMTAQSGVACAGLILLGVLAVLVVRVHVFTGIISAAGCRRRDS